MSEIKLEDKEYIVRTVCNSHCGGTCEMNVHVKGGKVTRIEADDRQGRSRMCARGHAYRQRIYATDRVLHPMKRTGERGSGDFVPISWDEALDTIAGQMQKVKATYGNAAILHFCSLCDPHTLHHVGAFHRLLCSFGGYTAPWGFISNEGAAFSSGVTYGTYRRSVQAEHLMDEYVNSKLIIMWSWNPIDTEQGTLTPLALARGKENGARIICVDPRFTDSAALLADEWVPIRPGTDAAVLIAMAYEIIKADLQDKPFIEKYAFGFDKYCDYLFGREDGVVKNAAWAAKLSGIKAEIITRMAHEYASVKPATLVTSIGAGRSSFGEQYHRAAAALETITGNVSLRYWQAASGRDATFNPQIPSPPNPVEAGKPPRRIALPFRGQSVNSTARVSVSLFTDAILNGKAGGYPTDYKMLWLSNTNYLNQLGDTNKATRAFKKLDFMLVTEQFMTPTAKFADILLPVCTFFERTDLMAPRSGRVLAILNKAIDPIGESRSQLDICQRLAAKLGITDYPDKSDEDYAKYIVEQLSKEANFPEWDKLKTMGVYRAELKSPPPAAAAKPAESAVKKEFNTPSGKIEIYSTVAEKMKDPLIPALPKHMDSWESLSDPLVKKYPLQLVTPHYKLRAHSQFDNLPWLQELMHQTVFINTADAAARGIKQGELVRVFNDRGETRIPASVTERIMAGVVALPQGAWYKPDKDGGCANVLTKNVVSPGSAFSPNTALVQIAKVGK